jgi:hypothetical protein
MNADELKRALGHFTGTVEWHRATVIPTIQYVTDGVKYLIDNAEAYWLVDAIASHQLEGRTTREPFQAWTLKKHENGSATLKADDGNDNWLVTQEIEYTDFPLDEIKLYLVDGILLLPSEY